MVSPDSRGGYSTVGLVRVGFHYGTVLLDQAGDAVEILEQVVVRVKVLAFAVKQHCTLVDVGRAVHEAPGENVRVVR